MSEILQVLVEKLVKNGQIASELKKRQDPFEKLSVDPELQSKYEKLGWELEKGFKTRIRLKKPKSADRFFEDEIWTLFAKLGFSTLNRDRSLQLPYNDSNTQQVDVLAIDDEAILVVECKACKGEPVKGNFKEVIEAIGGKKDGLIRTLRKAFPGSKHKIKFIFATKNYYLTQPDKDRLDNFDILHFDEESLAYYQDLQKHLGLTARFQLLGNIFAGQTIPEIDNRIPAIRGKMGGHTYYSFSIEPEKLLKIGYVLHRNKANKKLMPTYQRLIKKTRLIAVQNFIDDAGFFPNSLVINVEADRALQFDLSNTQVENSISKIGILHLPKTYRSAYIIDGQHRLYGYANSEYRAKNSIPVVAFVNLNRTEQVRLFMQINENQKAVPKNLRNTLNADLLWNSSDLEERIKAVKLQIAQDLGEDIDSPLYDRVIIGENVKTYSRCITIDTIKMGLDRSNFFGQASKNILKKEGSFLVGDSEKTYDLLLPFLKDGFRFLQENLREEWSKGERGEGVLCINAGVESFIRLLSDITDHLVSLGLNPRTSKTEDFIQEAMFYLDPVIHFYRSIKPEERTDLRKSYGVAGRTKYWRRLQQAVAKSRPGFSPDGLQKYWEDEARQYNEESFKMIRDIETYLKSDFQKRLEASYGANWFKKGVPPQVQDAAVLMANQKNRELEDDEAECSAWDCINIIDYRRIAIYGSNWRDIFEKVYTKPGEEKISGGKEEKTKWMQKLERIRNQNFHSYSIKHEEFEFLNELCEWLISRHAN